MPSGTASGVCRLALFAAVLAVVTALVLAPAAVAEPATSAGYPSGATATRYSGLAFDACTAPPLTTMQAWGASRTVRSACTSAASTAPAPSPS